MINSIKNMPLNVKVTIGIILVGLGLFGGWFFVPGQWVVTAATVTPTSTVTATPSPTKVKTGIANATITPTATGPVFTYTIINTYPHDPYAFTQGLIYTDGILYEGTGLYGRSSLRKVKLETGEVITTYNLPSQFFGEGITIFNNKIIQLTWQNRLGFVYDKNSFALQRQFNYPTEGWGITHDGQRLIMSDGTATLYFWNPDTLAEIGQIQVHDHDKPIVRLNELEYVNGEIYANIWQTDFVVRIDPQSGQVTAWISLAGLLGATSSSVDVLNGIAYDAPHDRLFVTGKLWPSLFEIKLVPISSSAVFLPIVTQ